MNAKEYYKKSDQILKKYHNGLRKLEERTYLSLVETASEITLLVQILETEKYKELISPKLRKLLLEWVGNKNKALTSLEKEVEAEDFYKCIKSDLELLGILKNTLDNNTLYRVFSYKTAREFEKFLKSENKIREWLENGKID